MAMSIDDLYSQQLVAFATVANILSVYGCVEIRCLMKNFKLFCENVGKFDDEYST